MQKRKHPKFLRPNYGRSSRSRIKKAWRRPRGIDNKKRLKIAYMGASPSIGYRQPNVIRYNHPKGMPELLVQSPVDLKDKKGVAVRIASGVGRKKREAIIKLAESMKLPVLNKSKIYKVIVKRVKSVDKKDAPVIDAKVVSSTATEKSAQKQAAPVAPVKPAESKQPTAEQKK